MLAVPLPARDMPRLPWGHKKAKAGPEWLRRSSKSPVAAEPRKDLWGRAHELLCDNKRSRKLLEKYESILLSEAQDKTLPVAGTGQGPKPSTSLDEIAPSDSQSL